MQKIAIPLWIATLTLLLLPLGTVQASKLYKWVDESGQVHYTQTPPAQGQARQSQEMQLPRSVTAVGNADSAAAAAVDDSAPASDDPVEQFRAIRAENCKIARQNLEVYKTSERISQADGQVLVLDDQSRAAKIAEAEGMIREFCD